MSNRKFRLELDMDAFWDLRNSPEVKADLEARAKRVRDAALAGYEAEDWERNPGFITGDAQDGAERARAGVVTGNPRAARHAAKNNTLLRALEAGRG